MLKIGHSIVHQGVGPIGSVKAVAHYFLILGPLFTLLERRMALTIRTNQMGEYFPNLEIC